MRLKTTVGFFQRAFFVSLAFNVVLLLVIVRGCVAHDTARAILVDGDIICLVRSERAAHEVHEAVLAAKKGDFPGQASFAENWSDQEWPAKGENILTTDEAIDLLNPKLNVLVEGFAIQVDGRTIVAMPTQESADEVLNTLKAQFISEGETLLEPQGFEVDPAVAPVQVSPGDIVDDIHTAADELMRGTTVPTAYAVKAGDTPFSVAEANNMTLAQLYELNPGLEQKAQQNDIHPGDSWSIAAERPRVVVLTRKETTRVLPIQPSVVSEARSDLKPGEVVVARPGVPGEKKEWIQGTWRNDHLVQDSVRATKSEVLTEAIDKRVLQGPAR